MRVLFSMRHSGSVRMYESVIRQLATAGHEVVISANARELAGTTTAPDALFDGVPGVRWHWEEVRPTAWLELATALRIWQDYLRYFERHYAAAPRLRSRAAERVPPVLRRVSERWFSRERPRRALAAVLRAALRAVPRHPDVDALVRSHAPDVVLVTPLLHLGSPQIEVLRSAKALGVRTGFCVGSWDHLSSKSLIREMPDRVFVWNDVQRREAVELHGVPADRVVVTGAQCYDEWFERKPARTREQFCAMVKLPADRPFLLWACSALFAGSPSEAQFVRQWIGEVRASDDPVLRTAGILVRPHPARLDEWAGIDLSGFADVAVHGALPVDRAAKDDYFDSLSHAAAVVGLNTSAFLEAAIAGRPVHTILLPQFQENQEGTLHFHYLRTADEGLLECSRSFDAHRSQLSASLRAQPPSARSAAFVASFIRPLGVQRRASDAFVAAIGQLAQTAPPAQQATPAWALAARALLAPAALLVHWIVARGAAPSSRTVFELRRSRQKEQHRRARDAHERQRLAEREVRRRERLRAKEEARQEALRARAERIAAAEQQKGQVKAAKEQEKARRARAKRRAAFVSQVKRRIGVGQGSR
jgi:hypothetical protein